MTQNDSPRFLNSLAESRIHWSRWAISVAVNSALVLFLLALSPTVRTVVESSGRSIVTLIAPRPAPVPPPLPVRRKAIVTPTEVKPVRPVIRKSLPIIPPPKPEPVKIVTVEPPKLVAPPVSAEPILKSEITAARPVTRESGFENAPAPAPAPAKAGSVRTGAFGDPNGVPASATARPGTAVARLGSFDAAGVSGGTSGGARAGAGAVTTGGFGSVGSGSGAGPGGGSQGTVRNAGFGQYVQPDATAPREVKAVQPAETPVEILSKPKPVYTAEAREHRIEGEVQFEVLFSASGQVHIIRMLRGLGWGLDEHARDAASQIRFRPGTRNGVPVDMTGTVHIVFELS
jgi:TonB family protein